MSSTGLARLASAIVAASMLVAALSVGIALRTVALERVPAGFNQDEACNGYDAYSLLHTGRDQHGNLPAGRDPGFQRLPDASVRLFAGRSGGTVRAAAILGQVGCGAVGNRGPAGRRRCGLHAGGPARRGAGGGAVGALAMASAHKPLRPRDDHRCRHNLTCRRGFLRRDPPAPRPMAAGKRADVRAFALFLLHHQSVRAAVPGLDRGVLLA